MGDLKKLTELRDLLKGMFTKPGQPAMVPAIQQPSVKPLTMPPISIKANTSKIPGMAPPSQKDPKKMVQQFKNPRPQKPKTEMLKVEKNGQWKLV